MYLIRDGVFFVVIIVFVCYLYFYILVIYEDDYLNIVKLVIELVKWFDSEIVEKIWSYE